MDDDKVPGLPRFPRIDLSDPEAMQQWCEKFRCTSEQLAEAVGEVGPVAEDVEKFLSHRLP